jgi:hypothetical protein
MWMMRSGGSKERKLFAVRQRRLLRLSFSQWLCGKDEWERDGQDRLKELTGLQGNQADNMKTSTIDFLDPSKEDEYDEDPEFSDLFEPGLWLINQHHDIILDPAIHGRRTPTERLDSANLGVLEHSFGPWKIYVNWQIKWAQKIPPHHMAVEFAQRTDAAQDGTRSTKTDYKVVGIISPYMTCRCCWNCGRGNPIVNGQYDDEGYYLRVNETAIEGMLQEMHKEDPTATRSDLARAAFGGDEIPEKFPACLPHHACPKCGAWDWFGDASGVIARPEDFQRDCAESLALVTGDDIHATSMRYTHDPTGKMGVSYARTGV